MIRRVFFCRERSETLSDFTLKTENLLMIMEPFKALLFSTATPLSP